MSIEHISYNALSVALGGDYAKLSKIIAKFSSFAEAWGAVSKNDPKLNEQSLWEKMLASGTRLILKDDDEFPTNLREIPYPPFGIYIKGEVGALNKKSIAIVGTRRATPFGKNMAKKFAYELVKEDFAISSGLALGVDASAHSGALEAGGVNIAVLACGLDKIYPVSNEGLAQKILETGGAIISEYPIESPAYAVRFLERNRIISGLAIGTLVIEAPERSGSLATARFALEQNRNVYVIPGAINSQNYKGSNSLIKAGAMLVTEHLDILKDLNIEPKQLSLDISKKIPELNPEEALIFKIIKQANSPLVVDKIIELSNYEPYIVSKNLTFLLLKDIIKESGGHYEVSL